MHKINNLLGMEKFQQLVASHGIDEARLFNRTRCTGKSLCSAMGIIHTALSNPNKRIPIREIAYGEGKQNAFTRNIEALVIRTCETLDLKCMETERKNNILYLTYKLWGDEYV